MRCPNEKCGHEEIRIWADRCTEVLLDVNYDVIDEQEGELYWDETTAAMCDKCHWAGFVGDCEPKEQE